MPRFDPVQSNFTSGEISPEVLGNFELDRYKQALNKCENFLPKKTGGVSRRGGTKYIAKVKDSADATILVPLNYKDEYQYIIEFGDEYIRFYRNQAQIVLSYSAWVTSTVYEVGDLVTESGSYYRCLLNHTSGTFATDLAAGKWVVTGGATDLAYEIPSPYDESDIQNLRFSCDETTLFITHNDYAPKKLTRSSHTDWNLIGLPIIHSFTEHEPTDNTAQYNDVCWSPDLGLFCAVSSDATYRVMTSVDGVNWEIQSAAESNSWISVVWAGGSIQLFVAVSTDGTNRVMTSPDGITWTARVAAELNSWGCVCWNPDDERLVAVSTDGTNRVMYSDNGTSWTAAAAAAVSAYTSVCWDSKNAVFVAVANSGNTYSAMYSANGVTWTASTSTGIGWNSVAYSPILNRLVAVGTTSYLDDFMYSDDGGDNWVTVETPYNAIMKKIIWNETYEIFIAISSGGVVYTSGDGITWEYIITGLGQYTYGLAWSEDLLKICIVGKQAGAESVLVAEYPEFPKISFFYEQRFWIASTDTYPNKLWGSQSIDYFNFDVGTGLDNEAIIVSLKEATIILWAVSTDTILIGCRNGIFKLSSTSSNEALTPTNIRPLRINKYGATFVNPCDIDGKTAYLQKDSRKMRVIDYELLSDRYKSTDLLVLHNHLTQEGVVKLEYVDEPESLIYGIRNDGELMGILYDIEYKIIGGFRFIFGGTTVVVKSIAISENPTTGQDELWLVISRTINSATVQYIEILTQGLTAENDSEDATFMDSFVSKTGSGFTTFDGLDHLEGETVQVFADGEIQTSKTVSSGQVTITAADKAYAGLQYTSTLETLPLEGGNPIGSAMGKIKRISKLVLRLFLSYKFTLSDLLGNTSETITPDTYPFTGDTDELDFYGTHETKGQIKIVVNQPTPFNLLSIMYQARTKD